jgi:hypothetical protein
VTARTHTPGSGAGEVRYGLVGSVAPRRCPLGAAMIICSTLAAALAAGGR